MTENLKEIYTIWDNPSNVCSGFKDRVKNCGICLELYSRACIWNYPTGSYCFCEAHEKEFLRLEKKMSKKVTMGLLPHRLESILMESWFSSGSD